jgi:phospholipase C
MGSKRSNTGPMVVRASVVLGSPLLLTALAACSSSPAGTPPVDAGHPDAEARDAGPEAAGDASKWPTPPAWNAHVTRPSDTAAAAGRASCQFKRGDLPAATLGPSFRLDADNPIQNIVVLMQENHSFDTYMGHLYKYEKLTTADIDSAPDDATNPDSMGQAQPYQHGPKLCFADTDHSWHGSHEEWDNGKNDGFFLTNDTGTGVNAGGRALWWYDQSDIPFYYSLYSTFAIADQYHCALLGPTWPNRMYLYSATSFGVTSSVFPDLTKYPTVPSNGILFDELEQRGVTWNIYAESSPGLGVVLPLVSERYGDGIVKNLDQFYAQAKAGTLPQVTFVDANYIGEGPEGDDEHPPAQIQIGENFMWKVITSVLASPEWPHTAMFLTYDEHGGEFDHVPPPSACAPDDIAPILTGTDVGTAGDFTRYGFRVPMVLISPYAKKSYVSHAVYSHTSITRFIEAKFKVPALTARDANADPFTDMFDWTAPPFVHPPTFAEPPVNAAEVTYCESTFAP